MTPVQYPKIAVVIPVHNSARYLADTLASVSKLNYPRTALELIVVDDGSKDSSVKIIQTFLETSGMNGRLIRHSNPRGPSAARNTGWQATDAPWIQFLDSDDLIDADKLEIQCRETQDSGDIAILYSPWSRFCDVDGDILVDTKVNCASFKNPISLWEILLTENFLATGSHLIRRSALESIGGWSENRRWIEDVELHLRFADANFRFHCVPSSRPLFLYRSHVQSLSQAPTSRIGFIEGCLSNVCWVHERLAQSGQLSQSARKVIADGYIQASRFYRGYDISLARKWLTECQRVAPKHSPSRSKLYRAFRFAFGLSAAEFASYSYSRIKRLLTL